MEVWGILVLFLMILQVNCAPKKPHIIIIQADDAGFNDFSFRGSSEIPTPNIDALAFNGVILNRHYAAPMCTPSRASLLTGKYPTTTGMNHYVIANTEPWGLGLNETLMSEYLQQAGYVTNLVGKWHLGFFEESYVPSNRGFDSFFGYLGAYVDYYNYTLMQQNSSFSRGYDLRKDHESFYPDPKPYATELFTQEAIRIIEEHDEEKPLFLLLNHLAPHSANDDDPMQAPAEEIAKFSYIKSLKRRTLAAMISILDGGIGQVVTALKEKGILQESIIIVYSDNGGPTVDLHSTSASNHPLRGQKESGWDGGIRTNALIYSPMIEKQKRVSNELFHLTDWLPTFLSFTDATADNLNGFNQWPSINEGRPTERDEVVAVIDPISGYSSFISGDYKLMNGTVYNGKYDRWLGTNKNESKQEFLSYANAVLQSEASIAIKSLQSPREFLTIGKIKELRSQTKVTCSNIKTSCNLTEDQCVFNLISDPCEQNNVIKKIDSSLLKHLRNRLNYWTRAAAVPRNKPKDPQSDPKFFNCTWSPWR